MNDKILSALHEFFKECHAVADSKGWHDEPVTAVPSDAEYAIANRAVDFLDFAAVVESLRKPGVSSGLPGFSLTTREFRETINGMAPERVKLVVKLILIATEVAEAIEHIVLAKPEDDIHTVHINAKGSPDGVAVELADVLIRVGDDVIEFMLPIIEALMRKHEYNKTREHKHGKLV